jgi:hypothetical protein
MRNIVWILFACLVLTVAGCCSSDDETIIPGGNNTAIIATLTANTNNAGAGYSIPANTTVTSNSVVNGQITFGFGTCPTTAIDAFNGTVYGTAQFTPIDAVFNHAVTLTIPVTGATGTVNIYRWNGTSWVTAGTGTVASDAVEFTSTNFGCFLVGAMHTQGGGDTL